MLRVTGRLADGWLPSFPRLPLEEVPSRQQAVDEAARAAGRDPSDVKRVTNVGDGVLTVDPNGWADQFARLSEELRFEAFMVDPVSPDHVRRLGEDVAPRLRELT
jgi:alkanesulfonate monooxygenase SsuD/methylene tetrahydromethanopterin reductase-like flavin-dependent oxidoreductase (luciferase family)